MARYKKPVIRYVFITVWLCVVPIYKTAPNFIKDTKMKDLEIFDKYGKALHIADVICRFNTSDKRMVKVISGDDAFEGEVTKIEWDVDQWTYFVNGEWYCQSEINGI